MNATPDNRLADPEQIIADLERQLAESKAERDVSKAERDEALQRETATAEVLQVINSSPGNLTPVFEAMLEKAIRLCGGDRGVLWTIEGGRGRLAAARGLPAEFVALLRERGESGTNSPLQRVVQGEWLIEFPDTVEEFSRSGDPHAKGAVEAGVRSAIWVAIVKEGVTVGAFAIGRSVIGTFSDKQIALLQNFAAQAVIAMENARLITEQREALEQQTATAEVLQVINTSQGNLAPVFDAMLDRAMRLCDVAQGTLWMFDGERMCASATAGYSSELAEQLNEWREMHPFQRRLSQGERVFQIVDLAAEELYHSGNPLTRAAVDVAGIRTVVFVALVKDATTLGGFTIGRREVRAFTDKHIAVLQNFAEQAVIAMENARLITGQREALEQQTATAEVLQVINASPGDLKPVFDTMLEKAMRLCGGTIGGIFTFDGGHSVTSAMRGVTAAFEQYNNEYPMDKIQPGTMPARIIKTRGPVQNADVTASDNYRAGHPYARALVELGGIRALQVDLAERRHIAHADAGANGAHLAVHALEPIGLAGPRIPLRAQPIARLGEHGALLLRPLVGGRQPRRLEVLAAVHPGERPDRDRRVGRAEGGSAGLRDGAGGELRHQRQAGHVRGLALVGCHAERGVAFEVLDRAEALLPGERHVVVGDVVLQIDERLASHTPHAPQRHQSRALRIDIGHVDRLAARAAVGRRLQARPGTGGQGVRQSELTIGRAGHRHAGGQGAGDEGRDAIVPHGTRAQMRGEMHGRAPATRDAHEIAIDPLRFAGGCSHVNRMHVR
jgi:GAF domain-containing protein